MKITIKAGGKNYPVDFKVFPTPNGLSLMAKDSKNLDILQQSISERGPSDVVIAFILEKEIEKKLKLPMEVDSSYQGAGFGFKFDMYSIAKKLK